MIPRNQAVLHPSLTQVYSENDLKNQPLQQNLSQEISVIE